MKEKVIVYSKQECTQRQYRRAVAERNEMHRRAQKAEGQLERVRAMLARRLTEHQRAALPLINAPTILHHAMNNVFREGKRMGEILEKENQQERSLTYRVLIAIAGWFQQLAYRKLYGKSLQ